MITEITLLMLPLIIIILFLCFTTVESARNNFIRIVSLISCIALLIGVVHTTIETLSHPKPMKLEYIKNDAEEAQLIWARIEYEKYILVLIQLPDEKKPRYYTYEWDLGMAQKLQKMMKKLQDPNNRGAKVMVKNPFKKWEGSVETRKRDMFEFIPPSNKLPPKSYEQEQQAPRLKQERKNIPTFLPV